ncbi:MAG: hypothetical protein GY861_24915 [bacterium]|nr:hypothetical protein [bacterium]
MKKLFVLLTLFSILMISAVLADTVTIRPDGQGNYSEWVTLGCSAGSSEWQCVDETTPAPADKVYTNLANKKESFTFSNTGLSTETINSVTLYYYSAAYGIFKFKVQPLVRAGGTDYLGPLMNLGWFWQYRNQVYTTNPATGNAWTVAEVDALEAGMKSYSAWFGGQIAQMYAVVDYTASTPEDSCTDSDYSMWIPGNVTGYDDGEPYANLDVCLNATIVVENYCSGSNPNSFEYDCAINSTTCSSGACV